MELYKWNNKRWEFEKITLPSRQGYTTHAYDMNKIVRCVNCNTPIIYGESYTSKNYKNDRGNGYCICKKCYEEEEKNWGVNIWDDE